MAGSRASAVSLASLVRPVAGTLLCLLPTSEAETPAVAVSCRRLFDLEGSPMEEYFPSPRLRRTGVVVEMADELLGPPSSLWCRLAVSAFDEETESLEELMEA